MLETVSKATTTGGGIINYFVLTKIEHHSRRERFLASVRVQALLAVLDYSGEHNISITTNPYGFFLLFSCYLHLRACSLTLDIALPKIRYIHFVQRS